MKKGFTLVELLATLLIIGVVMGITIPNVTGIFNQKEKPPKSGVKETSRVS